MGQVYGKIRNKQRALDQNEMDTRSNKTPSHAEKKVINMIDLQVPDKIALLDRKMSYHCQFARMAIPFCSN